MFFYCRMFFVLKNMQYKICCSSHWQIAPSLFFSVYHWVGLLADKLVDINYSEKSLEWAETDSDNDSDCKSLFNIHYIGCNIFRT